MAQKYYTIKNTDAKSAQYGKYYAHAAYNKKFVETDELAGLIEKMTTVNHADVVAVLNGLGTVMSHYLKAGEKVRLKDIGVFKVGFSSIGVTKAEDLNATCIFNPRVLFFPETIHIKDAEPRIVEKDGQQKLVRGYTKVKKMIEGITFEEVHDSLTDNTKPTP